MGNHIYISSRSNSAVMPNVMKKEFFKDKDVLIMGLGRFGGGVDAAQFAAANGAKVIVSDLASPEQLADSLEQLAGISNINFRFGSHNRADFENADLVVANPAVAPENEFLETARRAGAIVTSQIAIFFDLCPAKIIGITGANGKSTTAALTSHILSNAISANVIARSEATKQSPTTPYAIRDTQYERVFLSGNIGNHPLLTALEAISARDLIVLELSSFQLEQLAPTKMAPNVALLTNLTPNHLDRHGTFADYCAAKENIFKFQKPDADAPAVSIFNAEDEIGVEWFDRYSCDVGRRCIKFSADDIPAKMRQSFPLPGRANLSNLAAACAIAKCFNTPDEAIERCLPGFKSLPDRLELVANANGVRWYNDSIATTPQSAIAALDAFDCSPPGGSPIIIAGGYDKKLPFDELGLEIAQKAKAAILLGQTAPKIAEAIQNAQMSLRGGPRGRRGNLKRPDTKIETVDSLAQAVAFAAKIAIPDDVVLLSPACASYDMFDNFQQRGREFVKLVRAICA